MRGRRACVGDRGGMREAVGSPGREGDPPCLKGGGGNDVSALGLGRAGANDGRRELWTEGPRIAGFGRGGMGEKSGQWPVTIFKKCA